LTFRGTGQLKTFGDLDAEFFSHENALKLYEKLAFFPKIGVKEVFGGTKL